MLFVCVSWVCPMETARRVCRGAARGDSPSQRIFIGAHITGVGSGKTAGAFPYRYIYIPHTFESKIPKCNNSEKNVLA